MTNTEEFKELVALDVRKGLTNEQIVLLSGNYRLWLDELNVMLRDVEIQLSAQKGRITEKKIELGPTWNKNDWYSFKSTEEKWRITALRFKASVEERIRFVKTLRAEENSKTTAASV